MAGLRKLTLTTGGFEDVDPVTGAGLGTYRRILPSLGKEIRSLENVIKSASNSFQFFNESLINIDKKTGLAKLSFYVNPSDTANVLAALKQFNSLLSQRKVNAGTFTVTREDVDVYNTRRTIYGTRAQRRAIEDISNAGGTATVNARNKNTLDIMLPVKQGQSKKDNSKYLSNILKQAMKYSDNERDIRNQENREQQEKEDRKREAKADMESKRATHKLIMGAIGVLTLISNLMRRLVTASFAQATADAVRARQAHDLQLTSGEVRQYEVAERVHGLTSGTILGGAQAFQNAFGNISSLDQKKIDQLAFVLGAGVANDVRSGLPSGKRPADLMQEALTAALARYEAGQDYLGNKMSSKEEARRSLVTWAATIDENFATILSQMIEDKTRGDYNFADFNSWLTSAQAGQVVTSRITDVEENALQSFTRNLNLATNNLQDMAEKIKINVALALDSLVNKVANIDFGKTDKQKFETEAQRIKYVKENLPLMQQQMLEAEQYIKNFLGEEFNTSIEDVGDLVDIPNNALAPTNKINAARKKVFADPKALVALATYKTMNDKSQYYQDAINSGKLMKNFNASDFDFAMQMLAIEEVLNDLLTKGATTSVGLRGTANITGSSLDYKLTSGNITFRGLNAFEKDIAKKALQELRVLTGENSTLGLLERNDDLATAVAKAKGYKNKEALINAYKKAQGYEKARMVTDEDLINALLTTAVSPKSYSNIAIGKTIEDYKDDLVKQGLTNLMLSRYSLENASAVYKQAMASGQYSNVQAQLQKGDGTIKIVMYGVDSKGKQYQLLETQTIGYDYSGENFTIDAADIFSQN